MSLTARVLIGLAGFASGVWMLLIPLLAPSVHPTNWGGLIAVASIFFLIPIACLGGQIGQIAVRILGALVFIGYAAYVVDEWRQPQRPILATRRSDTTLFNALTGIAVWGLPGALIAIKGTGWIRNIFISNPPGGEVPGEQPQEFQD